MVELHGSLVYVSSCRILILSSRARNPALAMIQRARFKESLQEIILALLTLQYGFSLPDHVL